MFIQTYDTLGVFRASFRNKLGGEVMFKILKKTLLVSCLLVAIVFCTSCKTSTPEPTEGVVVGTEEVKPTEPKPTEEKKPEPTAEPEFPGGTVRVGVTYDTPNMDHLTTGTTFTAQLLIFDTLVARGSDGEYVGLLAESWEVSDDNLTWTFTLKEGATFHDGTPFNAEAAKWFFDKARDPDGAHVFSDSYASVDEILAPDDTTLIFKLSNPWPNLLKTVSSTFSGLISPTAYEKYGEDYGIKYSVGTGPFMLEEWLPEEKTTVVRNPNYNWGPEFLENQGPPHIDKVEFIFFSETTTRVSELETMGIDIAFGIPHQDLPRLVDTGNFDIYTHPAWGGALFYIDLNQTKPPLDEVKVRQALNWAIDIETVASLMLGEFGAPAYGYMAEHWNCGLEDPKSVSYGYSPETAQALLDEAGWTDSDGDGIVDKDGVPFSMTMLVYNDTESQLYGELIQNQLAAVGVEIELQLLEYSTMVELFNANENELSLINYGWDDSDVYNLFFMADQIPYLNSSHIDDPTMDELLNAANTAPSAEERCEKFADVELYAIEQAVWVPLLWFEDSIGVNKRVKDYYTTPYWDSYNDITVAD
jgi:peptide/nickel transport system substrate-binding protein